MGIEAGPSGAMGVAGATSLAGTAPVAVGEFSSIVNEGPVSVSALENTMTITKFNPLGEIVFKPSQPLVIRQAEEVAAVAWEASEPASVVKQAEAIAAKAWEAPQLNAVDATASLRDPNVSVGAKQSNSEIEIAASSLDKLGTPRNDNSAILEVEPLILSQVEPMILSWVELAPALQVSPALEPVAKTKPQTEQRVHYQAAHAISPQPLLQEQELEEEVLEKVKVEEPRDSLEEEEEIEKTKRKFVVDERTLSQVVLEIKGAVRKAWVLAGKLGIKITGKLIGSFLPVQHPGNESEAVKGKGPDGSIPERQQTIEEQGEFISDVQAEENAVQVAYEKPPIKIRSKGESVKPEVVEIVFKDHVTKPKAVAEEITRKRIVKKQVQVLVGPVTVGSELKPEPETRLVDYPELAEVFEKAA